MIRVPLLGSSACSEASPNSLMSSWEYIWQSLSNVMSPFSSLSSLVSFLLSQEGSLHKLIYKRLEFWSLVRVLIFRRLCAFYWPSKLTNTMRGASSWTELRKGEIFLLATRWSYLRNVVMGMVSGCTQLLRNGVNG